MLTTVWDGWPRFMSDQVHAAVGLPLVVFELNFGLGCFFLTRYY